MTDKGHRNNLHNKKTAMNKELHRTQIGRT